jgi:hypothetical protein
MGQNRSCRIGSHWSASPSRAVLGSVWLAADRSAARLKAFSYHQLSNLPRAALRQLASCTVPKSVLFEKMGHARSQLTFVLWFMFSKLLEGQRSVAGVLSS